MQADGFSPILFFVCELTKFTDLDRSSLSRFPSSFRLLTFHHFPAYFSNDAFVYASFLFTPLGKPADWAIYFTFRNFFLFFKLSKAISGSTGPIFTIFSRNWRYLCECCQSGPVFPIPQGTLPWQPILWHNCGKITYTPALIALSFRNRMGHRYLNVHINSADDATILCQNFVKFGPVTPGLTELICERQV